MTAEQSIRNIEHLMDAVNAAARNTPTPDPRAALVDLFESRAETHDDKSWITVEEAVDLVLDRDAETIAALTAQLQAAQATIAEMTEATDARHGSKSDRLLNIAMIGSRGRHGIEAHS